MKFIQAILEFFRAYARYRAAKKKWELVDTIKAYVNWIDVGDKDTIYYYLWENGIGERRIEIKCTEVGLYMNVGKAYTHPMYLQHVYPWLCGVKTLTPSSFKYPENVVPFRKK